MKHLTFARFSNRKDADIALNWLRQHGHLAVLVHSGAHDDTAFEQMVQHSSELGETDLRHGVVLGATLGPAVGALLGGVLVGLLGTFDGNVVFGAVVGAAIGLFLGSLMAGLVGAGLVDGTLKKLTHGLGESEVVVTVKSASRARESQVASILAKAGAMVAEKRSA